MIVIIEIINILVFKTNTYVEHYQISFVTDGIVIKPGAEDTVVKRKKRDCDTEPCDSKLLNIIYISSTFSNIVLILLYFLTVFQVCLKYVNQQSSEKFEDTKDLIISYKSEKDRQFNCPMKEDQKTKQNLKIKQQKPYKKLCNNKQVLLI